MKMHDLFESPISDISHLGNWEKNSSFRQQDRKLLTNPKAIQKIKTQWKYPEDVMFNILLVNSPDANKHTEVGFVDIDWLEKNMPRDFSQIEPLLHMDQANIIYTNNKGSERVPMTGWIMAHRLGHAMFAYRSRGDKKSYYLKEGMRLFTTMIETVAGYYGIKLDKTWRPSGLPEKGPLLGLLREICTFRAARENNIRNPDEAVLDLLAQFMFTGKLTFNDLPKKFKYGPSSYVFRGDENDYDYMNRSIKNDLAFELAQYLETALYACEGSILVM